jgi:ABC-type phosphate transport system substrate-binding protein
MSAAEQPLCIAIRTHEHLRRLQGDELIKRYLKRASVIAALGLGAVMLTAGASQAASQTTSLNLTGSGSDTTYFMMDALDTLYNQSPGCQTTVTSGTQPLNFSCPNIATDDQANFLNYFHDVALEKFPLGSSAGINGLCQHGQAGVSAISFARSSRVPLLISAGGTDCHGLKFVGYAKDAITWTCFPNVTGSGCGGMTPDGNGDLNLTVPQLKAIFVNCGTTLWSQVGGTPSVPIDVYVPQKNSGTGIMWASDLGVSLAPGDTLNNCIPVANRLSPGAPGTHITFENQNADIINNGDQANSIFPWSVGVFHFTFGLNAFTGSDGSQLEDVGGSKPTNANIQSGSFTLFRYVFNVYCQGAGSPKVCGGSTPAAASVTKYIGPSGFLCKNGGKFVYHSALGVHNPGDPILNPWDGNPYRHDTGGTGSSSTGDIPDTIASSGFVPITLQGSGTTSSYCVSQPLT